MSLKVVTGPATEPVTLTEAKLHCRVDVSDDDALITSLITAARIQVEELTWYALMPQTLELVLDAWPEEAVIEAPRPPLVSVTSIKYKDVNGVESTWAASNYIADGDSTPGRIALADGVSWPGDGLYPMGAVRVRYVAGFANAAAVPQTLKQAMLLLVGHWYENREGATVGAVAREIPFAVDALCRSYRLEVAR